MDQLFVEFLRDPALERYLAVRDALLAFPSYNPYSKDLNHAAELLAANDFEQAETFFRSRIYPDYLLSPEAHFVLGRIFGRLDKEDDEQRETAIGLCCLESGLLLTGDGSEGKPYLVSRTSDEYDVLRYFGLRPAKQQLRRSGRRRLDLLTTQEGRELWFDVTDLIHLLRRAARRQ